MLACVVVLPTHEIAWTSFKRWVLAACVTACAAACQLRQCFPLAPEQATLHSCDKTHDKPVRCFSHAFARLLAISGWQLLTHVPSTCAQHGACSTLRIKSAWHCYMAPPPRPRRIRIRAPAAKVSSSVILRAACSTMRTRMAATGPTCRLTHL